MAKRRNTTLSATLVERAKPGTYGDGRGGHGLYLRVSKTANGRTSRYFAQRVRLNGRVTNLGVGNFPVVTLAEARKVALENRRAILQGVDPRGPGIPTFEELAEKVLRVRAPTWKNPEKMARAWRTEFEYAFRLFGAKQVDRISSADVLRVLTPIWNSKRPTAKRVMSRISEVMKLAIAKGYRDNNPAGDAVKGGSPAERAEDGASQGSPLPGDCTGLPQARAGRRV